MAITLDSRRESLTIYATKPDSAAKTSLKARRKKAAWNDKYMAQVITGKFHA